MKLTPKLFAVAALGLTGLAVYVLYIGSGQEERTGKGTYPAFQTIGENRVLNIFRRKKIPLRHGQPARAGGNRAIPVTKADNEARSGFKEISDSQDIS